ncbi:MAG: flagellar protein FlaG [Nitrospiraceae bacterium]|nr:MAG: flagellar protein FlaG [Nitrospiraceae bacterium]
MIEGISKIKDLENAPAKEAEKRKTGTVRREVGEEDVKREAQGPDVKEAIGRVAETARLFNRELRLEMDNDLHIVVVKIVDGETDKVIRQIPPEELIELSKHAKDLKGLLINKEG